MTMGFFKFQPLTIVQVIAGGLHKQRILYAFPASRLENSVTQAGCSFRHAYPQRTVACAVFKHGFRQGAVRPGHDFG